MKKLSKICLLFFFLSCKKEETAVTPTLTPTPTPTPSPTVSVGKWTKLDDFPGGNVFEAAILNFGTKAYLVGGFVGQHVGNINQFGNLGSVWEFDGITQKWTAKKPFPFTARADSYSFVIDGKGYIVGGDTFGDTGLFFNDVWEYDPNNDTWTQKKDAPFTARGDGSSEAVNGKGYVGLGAGLVNGKFHDFADWWEYTPKTDTWVQKANFPSTARWGTPTYVVNGKIYTGMGVRGIFKGFFDDFFAYNPSKDTWESLASAVLSGQNDGFVLDNKIYACAGFGPNLFVDNPNKISKVFEYDPAKNTYRRIADLDKVRNGHFSFVLNGVAYLGAGLDNDNGSAESLLLKDFYSFKL